MGNGIHHPIGLPAGTSQPKTWWCCWDVRPLRGRVGFLNGDPGVSLSLNPWLISGKPLACFVGSALRGFSVFDKLRALLMRVGANPTAAAVGRNIWGRRGSYVEVVPTSRSSVIYNARKHSGGASHRTRNRSNGRKGVLSFLSLFAQQLLGLEHCLGQTRGGGIGSAWPAVWRGSVGVSLSKEGGNKLKIFKLAA
jgi:hypothetical protein